MINLNSISASLNASKVIKILTSLKAHPHWSEKLNQTNLLEPFTRHEPPQAIRISDFINKISKPLNIPFYVIWTWMCSDFRTNGLDPFVATENYLRTLLCDEDYKKIKTCNGPMNFRKALKTQRLRLGLSLGEMANKVGVIRDKIIVLEREKNYNSWPRCDTLNAVLPFYELHPVEFLLLALKVAEP